MDKRKREQGNTKFVTRRSPLNKSKRYKNAEIQTPPADTVIFSAETESGNHPKPAAAAVKVPKATTRETRVKPAPHEKRTENGKVPKAIPRETQVKPAACEKRTENGKIARETLAKPLSRLPMNYKNFAKPLSNNNRANSTQATSANKTKCERKGVDFCGKPGPKCSKQKSDSRVPTMLSNAEGLNSNNSNNSLPPINEAVNENTLGSTKLEIEEISVAGVQAETTPVIPRAIVRTPNLMERNIQARLVEGANTRGQHIQFNLERTALSISRYNGLGGLGSSSSSTEGGGSGGERNSAKKKRKKRRTYIRAYAHTVHIHNHFYKE